MTKDGDHIATFENFLDLPKKINEPLAVFKTKSKNAGFVVLTEILNAKKKPLMVALHIDNKKVFNPDTPYNSVRGSKTYGKDIQNFKIASIYARKNKEDYLRWKEQGLLLYENEGFKKFLGVSGKHALNGVSQPENYKKAPLPFQGQKRNWVKEVQEILEKKQPKKVIDLFGGSGLLSRIAKDTLPNCEVVYNDFDGFSKRIKSIPQTNEILEKLRLILGDHPREKKINETQKKKIIKVLKSYQNFDFQTVASSLLFSNNTAKSVLDFEKKSLYNSVKKENYKTANDYLEGLKIVSLDWEKLFEKHKNEDVFWIIDPPYIATDQQNYGKKNYFKIADTLELLKNVITQQNVLYFSSEKSETEKTLKILGFENFEKKQKKSSVVSNGFYNDEMYIFSHTKNSAGLKKRTPKIVQEKLPTLEDLSKEKAGEHFDFGKMNDFFGNIEIKPKGSVFGTLDAPAGAGKTRFVFQMLNEISKKYKVLFISLEEHPQSQLFKNKVSQYIENENLKSVFIVDEIKDKHDLDAKTNLVDVVIIDSWGKLPKEFLSVDNYRNTHDGKFLFSIFQRTAGGEMRGGSASGFDADLVAKVEQDKNDFKNNFVYFEKNRYQNEAKKYNIYNGKIEKL